MKSMPQVYEYVKSKKDSQVLKESLKNWTWKIEIAETAAKEAKKKLRAVGENY